MSGETYLAALQASPIVIGWAAVFAGFILFALRVNHRMNELDAAELDALTPDADSDASFWADVTGWRLRALLEARQ